MFETILLILLILALAYTVFVILYIIIRELEQVYSQALLITLGGILSYERVHLEEIEEEK